MKSPEMPNQTVVTEINMKHDYYNYRAERSWTSLGWVSSKYTQSSRTIQLFSIA